LLGANDIATVRNIVSTGQISTTSNISATGLLLGANDIGTVRNIVSTGVITTTSNIISNGTTQLASKLILSGQEFYQAANTSTDGIGFILLTNRNTNRQLAFVDTALSSVNTSNPMIRFNVAASLPSIDCTATDAATRLNLAFNATVYTVGSNKYCGIGNTIPATNLDVSGKINVSNGITTPSVGVSGGSGDRIILYPGTAIQYPYSIGLNTNELWCSVPTSGSFNWYVNNVSYMSLNTLGQLTVYDDITGFFNASDIKLKENIKPLTLDCTDLINKIKPVEFTWKDINEVPESKKNTVDYGFIAQDIETLLPHLVKELTSYKTIKYEKLAPYLVKAIQEMNTRLDKIEKILNI